MTSTSFHTRMLLMSSAVVGASLAAVIGLGWSRILLLDVKVLDERLCYEARRVALRPEVLQQGDLAADLFSKLQLTAPEQLMLRLDGNEPSSTPTLRNWPASLKPDSLHWTPALFRSADGSREMTGCRLSTFSYGGKTWHAAQGSDESRSSVIAADLGARSQSWRQELTQSLFLFVPLALGLTAVGSWILASVTMRPVNRLREAMRNMTGRSLDQRLLKRHEHREFQDLIEAYNSMLERLEVSFNQASRFSADAAHELKTPLTILQGHIEQAMHEADQLPQQRLLGGLLEEVGRLSVITRKLLLLSQADAGHLNVRHTNIDLSSVLNDVMHDAPLLLDKQQLTCDIALNLTVKGDSQLLTQVFNNLLSNAVRHGLPQGWIRVSATLENDQVIVVFANSCSALGDSQRQRFFDRFFRGERAAACYPQGSGLGLSLAREIARAHGGDLMLDKTADTIVQLRLVLPKA